MNRIWFKETAKKWREALPIGNGYTGVMIYGSHKNERLCFNDGTLWSGYPKDYNSAESFENLEKVRQLIFDGRNSEADALCEDKLTGFYSEAFMPLGDILLNFKGTDKKITSRSLDLSTGVHTVWSGTCKSEIFSSYPDKVTAYKIRAVKPISLKMSAQSKLHSSVSVHSGVLSLFGSAPDYAAPNYLRTEQNPIRYNEGRAMAFCLCAQVYTNGTVINEKDCIKVENATEITVYFVTATGFNGFNKMPTSDTDDVVKKCKSQLGGVLKNFDDIKKRHIEDFSALYNKQAVSFNCDKDISADELIKDVKNGGDEKALSELLYNYGKYMIISGSRKGGQALNLQGIWNDSLRPPWSSNYTVNINTQMNYWGASRSGLSECIEPLIQMVYEALETGRKTAEINYGCRGFACNHNVDLWRKTPPVEGSASYMFAPLCGVWLSNEIFTHYQNGFLGEYEDKIKEIVTESARFANDFLVLHEGKYVVCPSVSPENSFKINGKTGRLDYASAFDMGLVRQAFSNALAISEDEELKAEIAEKTPALYPFTKGENGICEWHKHYETPEKGHRHFSPLYAFYPANIIGYNENPEEAKWVRDLFYHRLANSGQHIGWSAAWAICLSARLRDSDTAKTVIRNLLCHAVFKNLFCVHPPFLFQIDGNLGFVAGINEMLLTEEKDVVTLIPALPENFALSGEVCDMVVKGAKISFKWQNGKIIEVSADKKVTVSAENISENAVAGKNVSIK